MYSILEIEPKQQENFVEIKVNERLQRICIWINQNFLLPNDVDYETGPDLRLNLKSLRDASTLQMLFEVSGRTVFYTSNMLLASNLIQSLANFLNLESLEVKNLIIKYKGVFKV